MNNNSPWIYELPTREDFPHVTGELHEEVVIIGAGISGITTAYHLLTKTNKKVCLLDASRICWGATGHNAGQLVAEFEISYKDLVEKYGIFMARDAEEALASSWDILKNIIADTNMEVVPQFFMGVNGYGTLHDLYDLLEENILRKRSGLECTDVYVLPKIYNASDFPRQYKGIVNEMSIEDIRSIMGSDDATFIAIEMKQKGILNSALFGEVLVQWMLENYSNRISVYERSPVDTIEMNGQSGELIMKRGGKIYAQDIILCTNGFENFTVHNQHTSAIDTTLHHNIAGIIGFMGAFHSKLVNSPMAYGYYNSSIISEDEASDELEAIKKESHAWEAFKENPYIYVTKRPFVFNHEAGNLTCIGGPEKKLADTRAYDEERQGAQEFYDIIEEVKDSVLHAAEPLTFTWHGLMGFTSTSVRIIGPEPKNKHLWYNLGCNGVGIMPAMYASVKIAQMLGGKHFPPSVFDPK